MAKYVWQEIDPSKPYQHHAGFVRMEASRCDLSEGFNIFLSRLCTISQLINGIAECTGHHAVNIRDNLPSGHGFTGYGQHQMRIFWDDGTEATETLCLHEH